MILNSPYISGSLTVTGNIIASGSITLSGSVASASYASNAELLDGLDSTVFTLTSSSSFTAFTASILSYTSSQNILNGTYATTGSNTFTGIQTVNSNLIVTGSITAQTLIVQTITSSVDFVTGSTRFGSLSSNTHQFTGSMYVTGALYVATGSVGIGTTSPISTLSVATTSNTSSLGSTGLTIGGSTILTTGNVLMLNFTAIGADSARARAGVGCVVGSDWGKGNLTFYTRDASDTSAMTTADERMRITSAGNVGIGTIAPAYTLDVSGTLRTTGQYKNNFAGQSISIDTVSTGSARMQLQNTGANAAVCVENSTGGDLFTGTSAYSMVIGTFTEKNFHIGTNSVTRMTIESNGLIQLYAGTNQATGGAYNTFGNLYVASTTAQGTDIGGSISIGGKYNNAGAYATFARIQGKKENGSTGQTGGYLAFEVCTDLTNNNTERMRITSAGNVGIGTTGFGDVRCAVTGVDSTSSNYVFICKNGGGTNLFNLRNDGYFQASGIYNFTSSGGTAVYCASDGGVYRFTSSERYKREITDYTKGLSKVLEIKPKWFKSINPKEGEKIFAGLIAEQIDEIGLNEFVEYNDEGQPDAVHYSAMTAVLVKAIQELKTQNDALQSRIETLESK